MVPSTLTQPIDPTLERIRSFSSLPQNWDSHGARPLSPVAVATADAILVRSLHLPIYDTGAIVDAAPSPDGGVLIEWESSAARFQLRVYADGAMAGVSIDVTGDRAVSWTDVVISNDSDVFAQLARLG